MVPLVLTLLTAAPQLELRLGTPALERCGIRAQLDTQLSLLGSARLGQGTHADARLELTLSDEALHLRLTRRETEVLAERALPTAKCSTWARQVALVVDRVFHDVRWSGSTSLSTPSVSAPTPEIPREPKRPVVADEPVDAGLAELRRPALEPRTGEQPRPTLEPGADAGLAELRRPAFEPLTGELRRSTLELGADAGLAELRRPALEAADAKNEPVASPEDARAPGPSLALRLEAGYSIASTSEAVQTGPTVAVEAHLGLFYAALEGTLHLWPSRSSAVLIQDVERGTITAHSGTLRLGAGLCLRRGAFSLCGGPSATLWFEQVSASGNLFALAPALELAPLVGGQLRPSLTISRLTVSLLGDAQAALQRARAEIEGTSAGYSTPYWAVSASLFVGLQIP